MSLTFFFPKNKHFFVCFFFLQKQRHFFLPTTCLLLFYGMGSFEQPGPEPVIYHIYLLILVNAPILINAPLSLSYDELTVFQILLKIHVQVNKFVNSTILFQQNNKCQS